MPYLQLRAHAGGPSREFDAAVIRMGRDPSLELPVSGANVDVVSARHARLVHRDGAWWLEDLESKNGTFLNELRVLPGKPAPVAPGAVVGLGRRGPRFVIERVRRTARDDTAPEDTSVPPGGRTPEYRAAVGSRAPESAPPPARRSFGGKGKTVFFQELFAETHRRTARRVRWVAWSLVVLLAAVTGALYWYGERRVQEALAHQEAVTDSLRRAARAEYERLRADLARARDGAAPAAVVESLRTALAAAEQRTGALEASLARAQASLAEQLAAGDSVRGEAARELARLRAELARARDGQPSTAVLDSLRRAVAAAETRAAELEARFRAVQGVDLAAVAQANQAAVGLVTAYIGREVFDASGFALTASGFFVTNRHGLVLDGRGADSVFVTMADERAMRRADVVTLAPANGPDLAVLKIRRHNGTRVRAVDWAGTRARQGEPAALIGFPAGLAAALDGSRTVRTSMSAGIFSKVTPETIQFDGFTIQGSSGSPIFNASGDVVGVHRAGLRDAVGLGFAEPAPRLLPLLPAAARAELGLR